MAKKGIIISASRRTDIPAFYAKWFINRIRAGYLCYPNPMFPSKKYVVDLSPDQVAGIVFWSRNPAPMLSYLPELSDRGFCFYFMMTLLNYPRALEPHTPGLDIAVENFQVLAGTFGKERVIWRYDPLIIDVGGLTQAWHKTNFTLLLTKIAGSTEKVIVSIVDPYLKTRQRLGEPKNAAVYDTDKYTELLHWMADAALKYGITLQTCCESILKCQPGPCIDSDLIRSLSTVPPSRALHKQRSGCLCHKSADVGVYDTCVFGCRYCYAVKNNDLARSNLKAHNPDWNSLTSDIVSPGYGEDNP